MIYQRKTLRKFELSNNYAKLFKNFVYKQLIKKKKN